MSCSRVYVGRLDSDVCEEDLERFFKDCGKINNILIKRGFAFVEFSDPLDADDAVFCLKGKLLNGKRINLELARGLPRNGPRYGGSRRQSNWIDKYGPICRTEHQLIVENLSSRVSWQDLKDFMRKSGAEVTYANAHTDRKNEGMVEFATYNDMMKAYDKCDDYELQGRRLKLTISKPRHKSRRSRSRSSSRSSSYERYKERRRHSSRSRSRSKSGSRRSFSRSPSRRNDHSRSRSRGEKSESRSRQLEERSRSISRDRIDDRERYRSRSIDLRSRSRSRSIDLYESRSQSPVNRE